MARSVLKMLCFHLVQMTQLVCNQYKVKRAYFCGTFTNLPLTQKWITSCCLTRNWSLGPVCRKFLCIIHYKLCIISQLVHIVFRTYNMNMYLSGALHELNTLLPAVTNVDINKTLMGNVSFGF